MKKNSVSQKTSAKKPNATQEQIIAAMQMCARKLKRSPSTRELQRMTGIYRTEVCNVFGTVGQA